VYFFYWDASALGKRYVPETGTALVGGVFDTVGRGRMMMLDVAVGEVVSILVRRHNDGALEPAEYHEAMRHFRGQVVDGQEFRLESVGREVIRASLRVIERHSLNATDALVLRSALDLAALLRLAGDDLVLVAADARLLRAAEAEGVETLDPESGTVADLDGFLAEESDE